MGDCNHQNSPEKDWLPMMNGVIKLHPHCQNCGVVRNISSNQGKKIGYFVNSLNRVREYLEKKGYKVSQSQMRLIVLEFEKKGLSDAYSVSFSHQKEGFVKIAKKYIKVSEDVLQSFL